MKIIAKHKNIYNTDYLLIKYESNFFAYGTEKDFNCFLGVPVQQTGTKNEIIIRLKSLINLAKTHISNYEKEFSKDNHNGWNILINDEKNKIEMYRLFLNALEKETV